MRHTVHISGRWRGKNFKDFYCICEAAMQKLLSQPLLLSEDARCGTCWEKYDNIS